jgi:hypothetical protein|tara:strand:- start:2170 stop:2397 length:228 start_codon:yes stop_codon:yes gene_type:complete
MNDRTVRVKKTDFDYWYKRGNLGDCVRLEGDVVVLVDEKDFVNYQKAPHLPSTLLTLAIYENYKELEKEFKEVKE